MLKEHDTVLRKLMIFFDICVVIAAFFLAHSMRFTGIQNFNFGYLVMFLPVVLLIWGGLLYFFGMYASFRVRPLPDIIFTIVKTSVFGFIIFGSFLYALKIQDISRAFIVLAFVFAAILLIIEKTGLLLFLRHARKIGLNYRSLLIVGTGRRAQAFIETVRIHHEWGFRIIGLIDEDPAKLGQEISGCKVIGIFKDVPDIIHNNIIDEVIFVVPRSWLVKIEEVMRFCEGEGVRIHLAVDYFELRFTKSKQTDLNGFPLLTFESTPDKLWHLLVKRLLDVSCSGIALFVLSPVFLALGILIKKTSHGPIFFKQTRCSLNGRKFTLYKFRTMDADAEDRLKEVMAGNEMNGPVFKMENDPRLNKVGKFLRKFSLDELPQLWNVFRGDMSLVGPRPPLPTEVEKYDSWQRRRLSIRPGITCLWQVNGRNKITDFNEWASLDLKYIDNWSLWLDMKIIFRTIPAMLSGAGAK